MKKRFLFSALACVVFGATTTASANDYFVEAQVGAGLGKFDDLEFLNPVGSGVTTSPTNGNYILLHDEDLNDASFTGSVAVGYNITSNITGKLSLIHFGSYDASGFATFGGNDFAQELEVKAYGGMFGLGYKFDLTDTFFLEPNAEIGLARVTAKGYQGRNRGSNGYFPEETSNNFAYGIGVNLGYRLNDAVTLMTGLNYYDLGDVETGTTGNPAPAGMNPGEQLKSDLSVGTLKVGIRYSF